MPLGPQWQRQIYICVQSVCQLLYKFERVQYADTLKENIGVPMAQLYGPIHLLRLITKLGPMLSATDIETVAMGK